MFWLFHLLHVYALHLQIEGLINTKEDKRGCGGSFETGNAMPNHRKVFGG
jgi:hypothetical protein